MLSGCFRGKGAGQRGESQVLLTMVVDMVSVVMEGVVMRNSFPPGAVPSTWGPEEELLEGSGGEKKSTKNKCSICHLGRRHPQVPSGRQCERSGEGDVHTPYVPACMHSVVSDSLCGPIDCSPPGSSVHGILLLEWVAISSSGGSFQPRDQTDIFCTAGRCSTAEPP